MRRLWLVSVVVALFVFMAPAWAQDQLGTVAEVRPEATGGFGKSQSTLIRGAELREGETVITGTNGEVQIVFADDTRLVIGRGSLAIAHLSTYF